MFVLSEYHNISLQLSVCEKDTIWTLIAEEMYYGLIFPRGEQCKTIQVGLTPYFISGANLIEWIQKLHEKLKMGIIEKSPILHLKRILV